MEPRLKQHYDTTVRPQMVERFAYGNAFQIPRLEKIVVNMGVGEAVQDSKKVNAAAEELARIAGRRGGGGQGRSPGNSEGEEKSRPPAKRTQHVSPCWVGPASPDPPAPYARHFHLTNR